MHSLGEDRNKGQSELALSVVTLCITQGQQWEPAYICSHLKLMLTGVLN